MAMLGGLNFYGFSVFFASLSAEFGWSRTALSGVVSLSRLEGGLMGPVEGFLIDKFGPRKMMLIGVPLMGLGFILLGQINSLWQLYIVYILGIALGAGLGFFPPVSAAIANWFVRRRSMAFGIALSGMSLGGLFLPLLGWWISTFGWRSAAVAGGVLSMAMGIPIALLMRHKPEDYGYLPDGAEPAQGEDASAAGTRVTEGVPPLAEQAELGPMQSLKTSAFWFLGTSYALRSMVTTGFTVHFVVMMVDRGFSQMAASSLLGAVAFLSLGGRLGLAWLGDRVDKRILLAISMGVMALTMLGMNLAQSWWLLMAILFVYAVAYGGSVVLPMGLQADYFGRHAFATIRGMFSTVQTWGMLLGPVFAGFVYDINKSYSVAFVGFAAACALSALLVAGIRRPVVPGAAPAHIVRA